MQTTGAPLGVDSAPVQPLLPDTLPLRVAISASTGRTHLFELPDRLPHLPAILIIISLSLALWWGTVALIGSLGG